MWVPLILPIQCPLFVSPSPDNKFEFEPLKKERWPLKSIKALHHEETRGQKL